MIPLEECVPGASRGVLLPIPPLWIWSTEILFQIFEIFHNILLNSANLGGGAVSESIQIPEKRIEEVGNHVETVGNVEKHF